MNVKHPDLVQSAITWLVHINFGAMNALSILMVKSFCVPKIKIRYHYIIAFYSKVLNVETLNTLTFFKVVKKVILFNHTKPEVLILPIQDIRQTVLPYYVNYTRQHSF